MWYRREFRPVSTSSTWYRLGDAPYWNQRVDDIGALRSVVDGAGAREVGERLILRRTDTARARAVASSGTSTWGFYLIGAARRIGDKIPPRDPHACRYALHC